MRILMLNWRDPEHPKAGGAEVVTRELVRSWQAAGHEVTWFAASWPGALPEARIDGLRIVRRGRSWTVHAIAFLAYLGGELRNYDLVVDQIHGVGFPPLKEILPAVIDHSVPIYV